MAKSKKRLEWTETAKTELREGMAYYHERNPLAARRMATEIARAAQSLIAEPLAHPGKTGRMKGTRELVVGHNVPYTLIYREKPGKTGDIEILGCLHQSREF
jgi:addiction module RelE/StbE family toxin